MATTINFSPYTIQNVTDSFGVQSNGFIQGDLQADPAARFQLTNGLIASTEALPMWGGIAIYEKTPLVTPANPYMGSTIGRAINNSLIAGFSVFNGTYAAPTTPQSPVPLAGSGGSFNYVRLGTNNRIVVACSSGVISLAGTNSPQNFSWDPVNQILVPYSALGTPVAIGAVSWSGGVLTVTTSSNHGLSTNNMATITGAAPAGYNVSGAVTKVDNTNFTIPCPINPGANTTLGSATPGLGGFSATLIQVDSNSAIVSYDSSTGFATWNNAANAAVIQI